MIKEIPSKEFVIERNKFEAWMIESGYWQFIERKDDRSYEDLSTQHAWDAWWYRAREMS